MKSPDEIKKALECCFNAAQCGDCPYYPTTCDRELVRDAREYIRQLEAERDEAYEAICEHCQDIPCRENDCYWYTKWNGVQKEG